MFVKMKNSKLFALVALIALGGILFTGCKKEEGCTDPNALNFDPNAEKDDGSCTYSNENVVTGAITSNTTWTADKVWILNGFVHVDAGATLTIEAGTVIKGRAGQGANASALIIARGAQINAVGTATNPIIFTAESDDVTSNTDIPAGTRGLWGGVIILGSASTNTVPAEQNIEGIPTTESYGLYGGSNDTESSGTFKYVSIRYGGTDIGAGNEINGLTMGGVGSGTTIEYVEILFNKDDGFEWFGGTVSAKWCVAAFCGDDSYDYDQGWRGNGQFWFAINDATDGDRGGEHDGGTSPEDGTPYATPVIYNATYVGRGESAGKRSVTFRDNAGGQYWNSIFTDYGKGIDIEILASGEHSYARFQAGDLALAGNVFHNVNANDGATMFAISVGSGVSNADSTAAKTAVEAAFASGGNMVVDPGFTISRTTDGSLNPIPTASTVTGGATAPTGSWFTPATYRGAFGTTNWMAGWTGLDDLGYF